MPQAAILNVTLDDADLCEQLIAEAEALQPPAPEILRDIVRAYVDRQRSAREHGRWFRVEVEQAIREADDPDVERITHEEVGAKWHRQRDALSAA